jgi:hypothetical protein
LPRLLNRYVHRNPLDEVLKRGAILAKIRQFLDRADRERDQPASRVSPWLILWTRKLTREFSVLSFRTT